MLAFEYCPKLIQIDRNTDDNAKKGRKRDFLFMKALRCHSDSSVLSNRETMTKYKLELESPRSNMIVSRIAKKEWLPDILPFSGLQED